MGGASAGPQGVSALVWAPFASRDDARKVARSLIEERLVACANIIGEVESVFRWNGAVSEASECGVLFKTDASLLKRAIERLEQLHPYENPAILGWRCDDAASSTADWLAALAKGDGDGSVQ